MHGFYVLLEECVVLHHWLFFLQMEVVSSQKGMRIVPIDVSQIRYLELDIVSVRTLNQISFPLG